MQNEHFEVAIVGGGLAGLTTAIYLARAGKQVVVLEKAPAMGGRAITHHYGDFYFNQGPRALYRAAGAEVLKELGVQFTGHKPAVKGKTVYQGRVYALPGDTQGMLGTRLLNWREKASWFALLVRMMTVNPEKLQGLSLRQWLNQTVKPAKVREFMEAFACVVSYTNAPESLDAATVVRLFRAALKGVDYIDYGWQTLVDGLHQKAVEAGVILRTSVSVKAVKPDGTIELDNDGPIVAENIVLAVAPNVANALTGGQNTTIARAAEISVPVKAACLDVGLRRLPQPTTFALNVDPPLYFSVHSASGAKLAPEGQMTVHILKYLHPDEQHDPHRDRQQLETFMDAVQPGWRGEVVEQRFLPNMTVMNSVVTAEQSGLAGRPGPATDWPNLFVVGDWVGPQGILADSVLSSARAAAMSIVSQYRDAGAQRHAEVVK